MNKNLLISALVIFAMSLAFGAEKNDAAQPAKKAAPGPAFAKVEDDPGLPRVLLIGDSISIGYTPPVRDLLKGKANVHRIPTNGGPTINGLKNLRTWIGDSKWDVIHFNWGLHDLKYVGEKGDVIVDVKSPGSRMQVPVADYEKNLAQLVDQLKATGAKLIWCSTTPVPEGAKGRVPGDEVKYNEAAARVMTAAGVKTDDLFTHAQAKIKEIQNHADVHYNAAGYKYLAEKVAAEIEAELPKK
jgi:acyl-CoA thioesterase-1